MPASAPCLRLRTDTRCVLCPFPFVPVVFFLLPFFSRSSLLLLLKVKEAGRLLVADEHFIYNYLNNRDRNLFGPLLLEPLKVCMFECVCVCVCVCVCMCMCYMCVWCAGV